MVDQEVGQWVRKVSGLRSFHYESSAINQRKRHLLYNSRDHLISPGNSLTIQQLFFITEQTNSWSYI